MAMLSARIAEAGQSLGRSLGLSLGLALVSLPLMAQDLAQTSGMASARVVRPVSAVQQSELAFGTITVGAAGGSVALPADGMMPVFSGEVRAACAVGAGCGAHPAQFLVSGEAGYSYRIILPQTVAARGQASGQMLDVIDLAAHDPGHSGHPGWGQLDAAGSGAFSVGGTLLVPPATLPDQYSADLPVNVTYD